MRMSLCVSFIVSSINLHMKILGRTMLVCRNLENALPLIGKERYVAVKVESAMYHYLHTVG